MINFKMTVRATVLFLNVAPCLHLHTPETPLYKLLALMGSWELAFGHKSIFFPGCQPPE